MAKTVVVVGAGFAGLAAAKDLALREGKGVRVVVLEGGDRVGGRACTKILVGLCKTEFGATYLHGMQGHHVYNLAEANGLLGPVHTKGRRPGSSVSPLRMTSLLNHESIPFSGFLWSLDQDICPCRVPVVIRGA
jgi:monoamine oxidase